MKCKRFFRIFPVFVLVGYAVLLSGCYDVRELDSIAIVTGVGLDAAPQAGMLDFTVQVGNVVASGVNQGDQRAENSTFLLDATAPSALGALNLLRRDNSRTVFLHHNQVIIFGKEQAELGIMPHIDMFMRDHETRMEVFLLVSEGPARDVLEVDLLQDANSGIGIRRMMDNKMLISKSYGINLMTFISKAVEQTTAPALPLIQIIEEENTQRLSLTGMGIFKEEKMIGTMTEYEAKGFAWVMGDLESGVLSISTPEGQAALYVNSGQSKIRAKFAPDGRLTMHVEIAGFCNLGELQGFHGIKMTRVFDLLQQAAEKEVRNQVMECHRTAQKYGADIYGFGTHIHRYHSKRWRKLKDEWNQIFPSIEIVPDVTVRIYDTGKIADSPGMQKERIP